MNTAGLQGHVPGSIACSQHPLATLGRGLRGDTSLKAGKQLWVHTNVPLEKPALRLVCVRVCQIWQRDRGKAATAPTPWAQLAARLSAHAHSTYVHAPTHSTYIHKHIYT